MWPRRRARQTAALAIATGEGVGRGAALCVQLALDGYFLGEAFKTIKLEREDREALRTTHDPLGAGNGDVFKPERLCSRAATPKRTLFSVSCG
jgi:hypothetical protein